MKRFLVAFFVTVVSLSSAHADVQSQEINEAIRRNHILRQTNQDSVKFILEINKDLNTRFVMRLAQTVTVPLITVGLIVVAGSAVFYGGVAAAAGGGGAAAESLGLGALGVVGATGATLFGVPVGVVQLFQSDSEAEAKDLKTLTSDVNEAAKLEGITDYKLREKNQAGFNYYKALSASQKNEYVRSLLIQMETLRARQNEVSKKLEKNIAVLLEKNDPSQYNAAIQAASMGSLHSHFGETVQNANMARILVNNMFATIAANLEEELLTARSIN